MDKEIILKDKISKLGINLESFQVNQFLKYYDMLINKNKVMNLTAITEFEDVLNKHFVDSLSIARKIDLNNKYKVIDVGTGAGFPGIPLKIVFPSLKIVLLDSLNKRVKFLDEVINELGLSDIMAVHSRAEECGIKSQYREQFDICVSRAVANLSSLAEYCIPFVKVSGYFVSYKSSNIKEELKNAEYAVKVLGGKIELEDSFILPDTDIDRSIIYIKKIKVSPKMYPRAAGKPTREPLLNNKMLS